MQPVAGLRAKAREYAELAEWCEVSSGTTWAFCRIGNSVLLPVQSTPSDQIWINIGLGVLVEMDFIQAKRFTTDQAVRMEALALQLEQEFAQDFANRRAVELFNLE